MEWANIVIQGVLVGGLYAMFAAGLALIFGVMRLVNIAHGDLIVLAAYIALMTTDTLGDQSAARDPDRGADHGGDRLLPAARAAQPHARRRPAAAALVTFGLSVIIQNALLELFTADSRRLQRRRDRSRELSSWRPGSGSACFRCIQFVVAVAVIGALQLLFYRTALGRAFRATSDDQSVAQLMGLDNRHVFALAMALSLAVVAVAGVFIAVRTNFDPAIGPARLIFGFEAVIIGGLGSMWGTLAGGIILGVSQAIGAQINPGWQLLAGHLAFLLILALRPEGLFPKVQG